MKYSDLSSSTWAGGGSLAFFCGGASIHTHYLHKWLVSTGLTRPALAQPSPLPEPDFDWLERKGRYHVGTIKRQPCVHLQVDVVLYLHGTSDHRDRQRPPIGPAPAPQRPSLPMYLGEGVSYAGMASTAVCT